MKKITALFLALSALFILGTLFGCSDNGGDYSLSIGTALSEDIEGVSISGTCAAVVTDSEGKILLCRLDATETAAKITDGRVEDGVTQYSKHEMGDAYGMVENGGAIAEWYRQAEFFESFAVGKNLEEISAVRSGDTELSGGCTIDVTDFVRAIAAAMKSDKKVAFTPDGEMTAGLAIIASVSEGKSGAEFLHDSAATVVSGGKVVAAIADSSEAVITLKEGKGEAFVYGGTKLELGNSYGMVEKGGAIAEWYEQAKNFAASAKGRDANDLSSMPVENVSGCTIDAEPLREALARAGKNVR